ncbi:MAG: cytochrome-c peroxidase [Crocinitomicaceae bacterium]|nr:cytochrome-c peroxidase [Crocinitomicaceae bacterium]|tara:strand:- start:9696 stop:10832 length:1137 start_codon:yes stop_codon:yes gene_type:complete
MKSVKSTISILLFILVFIACKKDPDPEPTVCDNGKPEHKRTEFILTAPKYFPPFPENTVLTKEIVNLGRHLFYEKRLSGDGTQSCASCHNQEFAFSDNERQFSEGIDGILGDVNAMNTFNLNWGNGFFWDGRSPTMEAQAIEPVINPIEMHNTWKNAINTLKGDPFYINRFYEAFGIDDWDSTHAAIAIAQFEKTLISSESEFDVAVALVNNKIPPNLGPSASRGYKIFNTEPRRISGAAPGGDCFHCHSADNMLFTDNNFQNNGLDLVPDAGLSKVTGKSTDIGKFKTPTLRNIEKTGPYMHDGRFKTLEEVVEFYNSGVVSNSPNLAPIMSDGGTGSGIAQGLNLTKSEKEDLIAFLKTLTDNEFLTNPEFSDPNK